MKKIALGSLFLIAFLGVYTHLAFSRPVPQLTGPVVDHAQIFNAQLRNELEQTLRKFHQDTGIQLQVLTLVSLEGDNLEEFSIRVAETWKIGDAQTDKGVILLFVQKERKVRIEVGQGLEGDIPDAKAGRIIHDTMIPLFKQGDPVGGVILGLSEIALASGHNLPLGSLQPTRKKRHSNPIRVKNYSNWIFILFWFVIILISILSPSRKRGRYRRGGFWYGGGSGGGFGGFSGGGGGWSGGGGGFSGGGASGSW